MGWSKKLLEKKLANFRPLHAPAKNLNLTFGNEQSYLAAVFFAVICGHFVANSEKYCVKYCTKKGKRPLRLWALLNSRVGADFAQDFIAGFLSFVL